MINLLKTEHKKYKNSYITTLGLLGMISPLIIIAIGTFIVREDLIIQGIYTWHSFFGRVISFFMMLIGPLITAFISINSIYYEYRSHTMENLLNSPNSRLKIILSKMSYVSLLVLGLYACVAITNIICAYLLGFTITSTEIIDYSSYIMLAGVTNIVIIPLMMWLTLIFKDFIPPMIIAIAGIIPNLAAFHWDKCYLSPFAVPEVIVLGIAGILPETSLVYPLITIITYFIAFLTILILYFKYSNNY
ncbi:ABC transporter permease [Methanobrevibacter sp. TMH8]|uniref:ABC transporter permease n=1 Tax=Methanobrevibacter sp. TMH8 TaxID=2848611 RepID=UPI001CCCD92C|nr:ABC transporter permease [Methanobrevibacter sp. TMH8]MBZ9570149.1 ABC transporter permease [Methanobrevibacter sp. TMH8]